MYQIFNISLNSDFPLPELHASSKETTGEIYRIQLDEDRGCIDITPTWLHQWPDDDGNTSIACGRLGDDFVLDFPNQCCFKINLQERKINCYSEAAEPDATLRHLLLDQVIPRVLGQHGSMVIHASAVVANENNEAIAFVGDSGWGKSTIAAEFYNNGSELLTDDCLLVIPYDQGAACIANYHGLRLYKDSIYAVFGDSIPSSTRVAHYSGKNRLLLDITDSQPRHDQKKLAAVFLLNDPLTDDTPDDISIEPVCGAEEMMAIIKQMFVLNPSDIDLMECQFTLASRLIRSKVPIFRLSYPRGHSLLPHIRHTVQTFLIENTLPPEL